MSRIFHFDLRSLAATGSAASERLFLSVCGQRFEIREHDDNTLAACGNTAVIHVRETAPEAVTHYAEVPEDVLPKGQVVLMDIVGETTAAHGLPPSYGFCYHLPARSLRRYARDALTGARLRARGGVAHAKLAHSAPGARPAASTALARQIFVDAEDFKTPWDTAVALLFQHPELASSKGYTAAVVIHDHIAPAQGIDPQQYARVQDLATAISRQGKATEQGGWARIVQAETPQGEKMTAEFTLKDSAGNVAFTEGDPVMIYDMSDETASHAGGPVAHALRSARNDTRLQNQLWSGPQGISAETVDIEHPATLAERAALFGAAGVAQNFTATNKTPHHGLNVYPDTITFDPAKNSFSIDAKNLFMRQLGTFVEYFSDTGMTQPIDNPKVDGDWPFYFPQALASKFETPSKKAVGTVPNVNSILGIPMPTDPTTVAIPWPTEAQALKLHFGGAGTSRWDNHIVWPGFILTGVFNYGIPLFFLAAGAAVTNTQFYRDFVADTDKVVAAIGVAFPIVGAGVTTAAALLNTKKVLISFASTIAGFLVKKGMEKLAAYITAKLIAAQLKAAVPYVGMAFRIASIALDVEQMAITTGEVLSSPAVLEVDILRQMQLNLTLKPDPAHGEPGRPETAIWPLVGDRVEVILAYTNGTNSVQQQRLPATASNTPLQFAFAKIGWGGSFRITANVYSKNGWLCGKYQSDEMPAEPDDANTGIKSVEAAIKELLVPLTGDTQYRHKQRLGYDEKAGEHLWIAGPPSTATQKDLNCSNVGANLCEPVSITMNEKAYQAGYVYRASNQSLPLEDPAAPPDSGQMYVMQNISVLSAETLNERLKFPGVGFKVQPAIAYDTFGQGPDESTISPLNFVLDSRGGEYHLRRVALMDGKPDFGLTGPGLQSWGRFYIPHLDAMVVHPDGYVMAVSWKSGKIQILKLPDAGVDDAQAPEAQIVSGEGILQGLTRGPVAIKVAPDGAVLVLETENRRVQAFDTKGNPVPRFPGKHLFDVPAADFGDDLDAGTFSAALQERFAKAGLTYLFSLDDAGLAGQFDAGALTQDILDAFADEGVYLAYNETEKGEIDPNGSTYITVETAGKLWTVTDPQRSFTYTVESDGGALKVFDLLDKVTVTVVGRGRRWVASDPVGARAFLLELPDGGDTIGVGEYLSFVPLLEEADATYLDLALEAKGYIYVLSHGGDGTQHTDYRVDIYAPDGSFLVRTPDPKLYADASKMEYVAAARLALDQWRNLFALGYEAFAGPGGRPEPTIGTWIPTPPRFDDDPDKLQLFVAGDMAGIVQLFADHGITLSPAAKLETVRTEGDYLVHDTDASFDAILSLDAKGRQRLFVYDIIA